MAPVGAMGVTKSTTTTGINDTSNKEFTDSNNNEGLSNGNTKNLLVISNEAYPNDTNSDENTNGDENTNDDELNKHTVNTTKERKINENNNSNNSYSETTNSSLDDLNDENNSCGMQDQLTLDSENTLNDFASSSSISVSSLSPLSDVNNNNNSTSNNSTLRNPVELLTAADEESINKLKSDSKGGDDPGVENVPNEEEEDTEEAEISSHVNICEPTSTTSTTNKTQIAAPNSLALHTNLNSSLNSNPTVSSEPTSVPDGLISSTINNNNNNGQTYINHNNKQFASVYVPILSSPSSSSHINIPYINQPMLPPTFAPVANYNDYQHLNEGLHYQGMGILLQPPLAGPSSSSTPDGSIPGTPTAPGTIYVHVDAGHVFQVQLGDEIREIVGPATVRMMSSNDGSQPMPIQLTTPSPGQIVQQIVDENGTHLILSSQQQQQTTAPSNSIPYNPNDIDPKQIAANVVSVQQPLSAQYQLNAQSPTFYPSTGIPPHQYPIQPNQQQHTLLPHHFLQHHHPHAQLHSPHHLHHYQPPPHHFQVQPQPSQYLSSLVPSPTQSPKPTNNIIINTDNLALSPVNDSQRNKNPTTGTNIVSLSPSSSSSCSSTSHTSIISNDYNKSAKTKTQSNQFLTNQTLNNKTAKSQHKEPKSFRKYNASSNSADFSLNNSSNKPYFSNLPFSNYQVINNSLHNKGPKSKAYNSSQLLGNPNSKKYQYNSQYADSQYTNMVELQQQQQQELVDASNSVSNKANKSQSLLSKEDQSQLNQELQKYFDFYKLILTNIKKPYVCDIEAQSVLVRLSPIELDAFLSKRKKADTEATNNSNQKQEDSSSFVPQFNSTSSTTSYEEIVSKCESVNYTLELANETNVFNQVYTGDANEITLKDLKPNTKYFLRVFASLSHNCRGDYTNVITFQTRPCEPEQPNPPKQVGARKKNEMTFRWTSTNDNGSKILSYILQCREAGDYGDSVDFHEVYRGPLKQFIVKKLTPSTSYAFRLAAENTLGVSEFSPVIIATTQGSVPNVPVVPVLVGTTISTISLSWEDNAINGGQVTDMEYELQMLDIDDKIASLHGYLTVCNGPILSYTVVNLKQSSSYQFRLRSKNEEGYSGWSEAIKFKTKANVPKNPLKLRVKIQQNQSVNIRVTWDAPTDNGGDKIYAYQLELSDSLEQKKFESIFKGSQLEYLIEQELTPGATYYTRVRCSNSIGCSEYSDIVSFITPSARPGQCLPPKLLNKAKPNSFQVKWSYPESDGGSPITVYELVNLGFEKTGGVATEATDKYEIVYKGPELSSAVNNLLSGRIYFLKVRAINEIGTGDWSDLAEISTSAGAPDAPDMPSVTSKSTNCLVISWSEPHTNGAPIVEYRLEMSQKRSDCFIPIYNGSNSWYECKGQHVQPSTRYFYRVQAVNVHGSSAFSQLAECVTQASAPAAVHSIKLEELTTNSMSVSWKQPNSNGCPVVSYNIDLTELSQHASNSYIVVNNKQSNCEYKLDSLTPDTVYKLRIQAINSIGGGHFSNIIKIKTKSLPPNPPNLECVSANYNGIKLKWNHVSASSNSGDSSVITTVNGKVSGNGTLAENEIVYNLEMMSDKSTWLQVYQGPLTFFKVSKLQEFQTYAFRLSATNETGQGAWSPILKSRTTKSPPVITKSPVVLDVDTSSCHVTWEPAKITSVKPSSSDDENEDDDDDELEYCLQLQVAKKDAEYRDVYKGPETWFNIMHGLEPGMEYNVRVCAIRLQSSTASKRLCSAFTQHTQFTTQKSSPKASRSRQGISSKSPPSSKSFSLSRFIWPSFYLNMNSSDSMANFKHTEVESRQTSKYSKRSSLTKSSSNNDNSNSSHNNDKSSHSHINNHSNSDSKLASGKQMSDQHWALFLILILVLIAFSIAFMVNYLYTSYYEVNQTKKEL